MLITFAMFTSCAFVVGMLKAHNGASCEMSRADDKKLAQSGQIKRPTGAVWDITLVSPP